MPDQAGVWYRRWSDCARVYTAVLWCVGYLVDCSRLRTDQIRYSSLRCREQSRVLCGAMLYYMLCHAALHDAMMLDAAHCQGSTCYINALV